MCSLLEVVPYFQILCLDTGMALLFTFQCFFVVCFCVYDIGASYMGSVRALLGSVRLSVRRLGYLVRTVSDSTGPALGVITGQGVRRVGTHLRTLRRLLRRTPATIISPLRRPPTIAAPLARSISPIRSIVPSAIGVMYRRPRAIPVLTRHVGPTGSLGRTVDLGSSFHFIHRLFTNSTTQVGRIMQHLNRTPSLSGTVSVFISRIRPSRRGRTTISFVRLLGGCFDWAASGCKGALYDTCPNERFKECSVPYCPSSREDKFGVN